MTAQVLDLLDDQIDRLLSEAEQRLSENGQERSAPLVKVGSIHIHASVPSSEPKSKQADERKTQTQGLTLRVPQLLQKKKKEAPADAGPDWFHMPKTDLTPELRRDLQLLRDRSVLAAGKQFFKKETRKDFVPQYCHVGRLIEGPTEGAGARLTRKERKRTIVEEVLSSDVVSKFKTRYNAIQERKMSGKKAHYKNVVARRRRNG